MDYTLAYIKRNQMKNLFTTLTVLLLVVEGHSHYEGSPHPQSPLSRKGQVVVASHKLYRVDPVHRTNDGAAKSSPAFGKKLSLRGSAAKLEDRNYEHASGPAVPSPTHVVTQVPTTRALYNNKNIKKKKRHGLGCIGSYQTYHWRHLWS